MTREATNRLLALVDEGLVDARQMLRDALCYMSEADVADFEHSNGYAPEPDQDEQSEPSDETDEIATGDA